MTQLTNLEYIVKLMVGKIPDDLWNRIIEIDELCRAADGKLESRQAIATIVYQWKRDNNDPL